MTFACVASEASLFLTKKNIQIHKCVSQRTQHFHEENFGKFNLQFLPSPSIESVRIIQRLNTNFNSQLRIFVLCNLHNLRSIVSSFHEQYRSVLLFLLDTT
jgi:hypothetical protein